MSKKNIATRVLSCLLVLTLLLTSVVSTVSFTKENATPTYTLKQLKYSKDSPIDFHFISDSHWEYDYRLTDHFFRGATADDPNNFNIVAYCMDWCVRGPEPGGSTYDHTTKDVSQEKINQLTYVLMNGYPYTKSYTITGRYATERFGRSNVITDDGGDGTMYLQLATQIAVWMVMGQDGRDAENKMSFDKWVRYPTGNTSKNKYKNIDCDIMEIAMDLYESSFDVRDGINWLSTDVASTSKGVYDSKTNSKLYGPFRSYSTFYKVDSDVTFSLKNAPSGTKIVNSDLEQVNKLEIGQEFYVSVPNNANATNFSIELYREKGMVLPLSYEEVSEARQRMFFSTLSSVSTSIEIEHTKADAALRINKTSEDGKIEGIEFNVYYKADNNDSLHSLGAFKTDKNGQILLTGLSAGEYKIRENLDYKDSLYYVPYVVDGQGKELGQSTTATTTIKPNGMEKEYQVYFHNKINDITKIAISKHDMYTYEPLANTEFRVIKVTKNANGQWVPLKDAQGNNMIWDGKTYDDSFGDVIFGRTDNNEGTPYLSIDAVYTNGELLPENNTYMIGETKAADGYVKLENKGIWTLTEENLNYFINLQYEDGMYDSFLNRPFLNTLKVQKYVDGTTTPIEGVTFNIYDTTDGYYNFVDSIKTDANGVAIYGLNSEGTIDIEEGYALRYGRTYVIKETSAPEGYFINPEYINVPAVTTDGAEQVVTVYNKTSTGTFVLNKTDGNSKPLEGTKFALYQIKKDSIQSFEEYMSLMEGLNVSTNAEYKYLTYFMDDNEKINLDSVSDYLELVDTYVTNSEGKITQALEYGDYILIETQAVDGYDKLNTIYRFSIYEHDFTYRIECVNDPIVGSVKLTKTNKDTGEFISGVKFKLYKDNSALSEPDVVIGEYTTDNKGVISVDGLTVGTYYFTEIFTPDRYELPEEDEVKAATTFEITKKETKEISFTNTEKPSNILIYKTDNDTGKPIQGVKFALLNGDGTIYKEAVTDVDGLAVFVSVDQGTYKLVELLAPEGYDIKSFEEREIVVDSSETQKINIGNEKIKADVKILKVDKDSNNPLSGVEFTLYKATDENNALKTLSTDSNGIALFKDVEYGEYVIIETKTIDGYKKTETKTFVNIKEAKEYTFTISNEMIKKTIKLIKVDKDTEMPIANVEFDVYALVNGEYIKYTTVTTDENGECNFTLPFGEYELRETKSSKGYKINNETTKIDLTVEDIEDILQIKITNELIKNKIILTKSGDTVGNYLAGAEYGLYDLNTDKLIAKGVTDENGRIDFGELPYGSYYFKEITPPEGYSISNDAIKFTVDENSAAEQIIDAVDYSIPQTGFNPNALLLTVLSLLSCTLFLAIVVLETKTRKAYIK